MGVVGSVKRTFLATAIIAVLAYAGFHALTKLDTSNDRRATVTVTLGETNRSAQGSVFIYIGGLERSAEKVTSDRRVHTETFWVRPGEKVHVSARLHSGKATLTCEIFLDGVRVGIPHISREEFEAACEASAVA